MAYSTLTRVPLANGNYPIPDCSCGVLKVGSYGTYTLHGTVAGNGRGNGKICMKLNAVWSRSLFQCDVNSSA